jgi:hypothetical protein
LAFVWGRPYDKQLPENAMSRITLALFVSVACTVCTTVVAQSGLGNLSASVAVLDKNFDAADRNHDGLLDRDEARAGHVAFIATNFDGIDVQHRGKVSKDDVHQFMQRSLMRGQPTPASSTK